MAISKKILSVCLAFLMVLSQTAVGAVPQASAEADEADWTILVYLCGSNLESEDGSATCDLDEMMDADFSDSINVVVETGGATEWQTNIDASTLGRYIREDDGFALVETEPAANMADEETLESFLAWGVENYPAKHMGLVFWNHGGGSISGVCFDEINDYESLYLSDIDTALEAIGADENRFEFIGFDACLMATFETANMLASYANYMYASEETEPGTGWDYTALLTYLAENPDADGAALGQVQADSYFAACEEEEGGEDPSITFSIIDLSKLPALVTAFDATAKEMGESDDYASIARGIFKADNFGGNNRSEGYTNMVDMADMLRAVSDYAPSAADTLKALESAVVYYKNGSMHQKAGGLALYYPLHIEGSAEISIFSDICPSTYYYALVAGLAENADLTESAQGEQNVPAAIEDSDTLTVEDVYLDNGGNYTVELESMDEFAYASCSVYMDDGNGGLLYIGEDDDVKIDYTNYIIKDDFDGQWLWLDDMHLIPIELVYQGETLSLYSCSVLLNGESTYLQIVYDWETGEYSVLGTWDGIDSETGMAARAAEPLQDGDVLNFVYSYSGANDDGWTTIEGDDIVVDGDFEIVYDILSEGDYYYAINLYDIYGNCYQLSYTVFTVNADGSVSYNA